MMSLLEVFVSTKVALVMLDHHESFTSRDWKKYGSTGVHDKMVRLLTCDSFNIAILDFF